MKIHEHHIAAASHRCTYDAIEKAGIFKRLRFRWLSREDKELARRVAIEQCFYRAEMLIGVDGDHAHYFHDDYLAKMELVAYEDFQEKRKVGSVILMWIAGLAVQALIGVLLRWIIGRLLEEASKSTPPRSTT